MIPFDEVAGITKYKQRKKEAIKLEETEDNIVRINDIIHEIERETADLKEQASQAERYQYLQAQLRDLELDLSFEYNQFIQELSETQSNLDQILTASSKLIKLFKKQNSRLKMHKIVK